MDDDATREFEFRKQKETAKSLLNQGDAYFVSGRLIEASASFATTAEHLRTCDARLPTEVRWKKAATTEIKRRIEMVMALLPKEKQHDAMEAMALRRKKEAEASGGDGSEDPEQLIQNSRRKLRHNCDRIKRQLALAQELRSRTESTVVTPQASLTTNESEEQETEIVQPIVTPKPVPLLSKVGSMADSLKEDLISRNKRNNVASAEWKFDGFRGVYLAEKEAPESYDVRPLTPREEESIEELVEDSMVGKTPAERLASRVGEPFVPLKDYRQLIRKNNNSNDMTQKEQDDIREELEEEVRSTYHALLTDAKEVEKGMASRDNNNNDDDGYLDSLEKELLLDSMKCLKKEEALPVRSQDAYATPVLDEMKIEQKLMDTRLQYALKKAPMIGRHHRLKLGLRGNNPS